MTDINYMVNNILFKIDPCVLFEDQIGPYASPTSGMGFIVKQYPFLANFTTIFGFDENGNIIPRNKLKSHNSVK